MKRFMRLCIAMGVVAAAVVAGYLWITHESSDDTEFLDDPFDWDDWEDDDL